MTVEYRGLLQNHFSCKVHLLLHKYIYITHKIFLVANIYHKQKYSMVNARQGTLINADTPPFEKQKETHSQQ